MLDAPLHSVLSAAEAEFFALAGVRSVESAYALLEACPSLDPGQPNGHLNIRRELLIQELEPTLSPGFLLAVAATRQSRFPSGGGAAEPVFRGPPVGAPMAFEPVVLLEREAVPFTTGDALEWGALDQGIRPTCIPHAVVSCIELMRTRAGRGNYDRLSVRFLYKRMGLHPTVPPPPGAEKGYTKLSQARDALAADGICLNDVWDDDGVLEETLSQHALDEGRANRIAHANYSDLPIGPGRDPGVARLIHAELMQGRPVAIALPRYSDSADPARPNNWSRADVQRSGEIMDPVPQIEQQIPLSGHAVCIVGFEPGGDDKLGGYFIFRNSIGRHFAGEAPMHGPEHPPASPAPGYGTISAWHVEHYVWELLSLERPAGP